MYEMGKQQGLLARRLKKEQDIEPLELPSYDQFGRLFPLESINRRSTAMVSLMTVVNSSVGCIFLAYKMNILYRLQVIDRRENQKGKGPEVDSFDLELLSPSKNYILLGKKTKLNSEEQANCLNAFEEEKRRIALEKGKECVDSTFTLSTANTPFQSTGNTPTYSDDEVPKDGVFSTNSFDDENTDTKEGGAADYNNMDPTIDVTSTPTLRIHKNHPQSQIIGKRTAGILTRRKLKEKVPKKESSLQRYNENWKWVLRNKRDEQLLRIGEAIRLLAFASFWLTDYQMDVQRAFLYGNTSTGRGKPIGADLLFDDADGVDCFPKQVLWDSLRDIGYEGNLAQLTFSKPLFSPQWKYLVHVLLHCLSPKSTSWEQFGTNIASALVGLATNSKVQFLLMTMNEMLGHNISNGTPFLMYPRFIQLFLNKQLEGVTRPKNFLPSVTLPSKVFTFMRKHSPKFSCRITPLTPPMLEVVTALAAEEEHSTSPHSRAASSARDAQGTPTQSAAQASISTAQDTAGTQGTAQAQDTDEVQDTDPNSIVESQNLKKRRKKQRKKHKKKVSLVKLGRNKEEGTLSKEHYVQDDYTHILTLKDQLLINDASVTPDLERKSDETEEINIEEKKASDVKSGDTEELDLEAVQSTARQSTITPRTLNFNDEAGPSSPIRPTQNIEPKE
ncbi:hypothetical protein Tco_1106049 [Tanacetum coccineum]